MFNGFLGPREVADAFPLGKFWSLYRWKPLNLPVREECSLRRGENNHIFPFGKRK